MDWQAMVYDLGLPPLRWASIAPVAATLLTIVGAYAVAWYAGRRACGPIADYMHRLGGRAATWSASQLAAVVSAALAVLLLVIASNVARSSALPLLLFAIAIGVGTALLLFRCAKLFGLGRAVASTMALIGLAAATAATLGGLAPLTAGLSGVAFSIGNRRFSLLLLANATITIAILVMLARVANKLAVHAIGRTHALDMSQKVLVQKLAGIGVVIVAVFLGIDLLGIDLTALTVFSGALGLAVGFGLQKTFGNLIAGLILLMDRSIKPGDVIVVGDTVGAVNKIGVRAVSVVTRDGKEHLIPNEQLMTEAVENWSYSSRNVRVHIPVGVAYSSDLALAQRLMVEAAVAATRVLADPKPSVWLKAFGDSAVEHDILVWIADPEMGVGNVRSDILNRLWLSFADHGIEIPFPSVTCIFGPCPRTTRRRTRISAQA